MVPRGGFGAVVPACQSDASPLIGWVLLQVILNFSWVMPAGSISLLVGLSAKGGRLALMFWLIFLIQSQFYRQLVVNGQSRFGIVMSHVGMVQVQAWLLGLIALIFTVFFGFLCTDPDITKR